MTLIQSVVLGIVQGISEFLPISSSGHLILIPEIFGWAEQTTSFDIVLHAGTLFALLVFFNKNLLDVIKNKYLVFKIIVASIPLLIVGYLAQNFIEENFKSALTVALALIIFGIIMIAFDRIYKYNKKEIKDMGIIGAIAAGIFQIFSLVRGSSRSGTTILGGLVSGLKIKEATRFSFLVAIPTIGVVILFQLYQFVDGEALNESVGVLIGGFVSSFLSGFLAIKFMMNFIEKRGLTFFGIYRIILGIIVLIIV
ncbi:undecaprenyl-diphosphate phosphatase [Candidatus Dojkabacteria bacterium]|nr:undecaprenyl-diphosphate phosphatase [Candidatus Dojkabacteria bacterium]